MSSNVPPGSCLGCEQNTLWKNSPPQACGSCPLQIAQLLPAQLSSQLTSLRVLPCSRRVSTFRVPGVNHLGSVLGHQFDQPYGKTKYISVHVLMDARDAEVPPREAGQCTRANNRGSSLCTFFVAIWLQLHHSPSFWQHFS